MATTLFLRSSLLDVPHGFSLRTGGVSRGAFASLNLGRSVGDAESDVLENERRLSGAAGLSAGRLATVRQVHGDRVMRGTAETAGEADALWTDDGTGTWVGVRSADCVPVLVATADGRAVAAIHSGWRGTALRVAARAVEALGRAGVAPGTLRAVVGPCIQACCYEVGADLAERFRSGFGEAVIRKGGVRPHLDLSAAVRETLVAAGLLRAQIDVLGACTACDPERFFSHRRDGGVTGRHLAFIAPAPLS